MERQPALARVDEAAKFLNVSRSHMYGLMEKGEVAFVRLGKSRRIRWQDLEQLVQKNLVASH